MSGWPELVREVIFCVILLILIGIAAYAIDPNAGEGR